MIRYAAAPITESLNYSEFLYRFTPISTNGRCRAGGVSYRQCAFMQAFVGFIIGKGCRAVSAVLVFYALTAMSGSLVFSAGNNGQSQCDSLFAQGAELEKQGDYAGAGFSYAECRELAKVHKLPKIEASALHRLAVIKARSKKFTDSAEMFRSAAALDKKNVVILCDFAQLYADRRMYDDAETILKNAMLMEPNNPKVLYCLGMIVAQQRDREAEGCRYLKLALGESQAYRELAKIYRTKSMLDQAEFAEQKAALAAANPVKMPEADVPDKTAANSASSGLSSVKPPVPVLTATPPSVIQRTKEDLIRLETREIAEAQEKVQAAKIPPNVALPHTAGIAAQQPLPPKNAGVAAQQHQPLKTAAVADSPMRDPFLESMVLPPARHLNTNAAAPKAVPNKVQFNPPAATGPVKMELVNNAPPKSTPADLARIGRGKTESEAVTFIRPKPASTSTGEDRLFRVAPAAKNSVPKNANNRSDRRELDKPLDRVQSSQTLRVIPYAEGSPSVIVEPEPPPMKVGVSNGPVRQTPLVGSGLADSESQVSLIAPLPNFMPLGIKKTPATSAPQTAAVQPPSAGEGRQDVRYSPRTDFVLKTPAYNLPQRESMPLSQPIHLTDTASRAVQQTDKNRVPPPTAELYDEFLANQLNKTEMESVKVADNFRQHLPAYTPIRNQPPSEYQFAPHTAPNVLAFGVAEKKPVIPPAAVTVPAERTVGALVQPPQVLDFVVREPQTPKAPVTLQPTAPQTIPETKPRLTQVVPAQKPAA
ncbi:MAG: hypothetical protein LBT89_06760, partial [Planctomycetaceae bacterium]|nr:hypothetical protein [Planctomycetaceae bacterium]